MGVPSISLAGYRNRRRFPPDLHRGPEGLRSVGQALEDVAGSGPGRRGGQASRVQELIARVRVVHIRLAVADGVQHDRTE